MFHQDDFLFSGSIYDNIINFKQHCDYPRGFWFLLFGDFFVIFGYYPILLYYDGYLTVLKNNMDELNYLFVPHQATSVIQVHQQVTIRYFMVAWKK